MYLWSIMTKWNWKKQKKVKEYSQGSNSEEATGEAMFIPGFVTPFHIDSHGIYSFYSLCRM